MSRRTLFLAILVLALLFAPMRTYAQTESILDFHSDISISPNGTMHVIETIRVFAARRQIRHGIYRDFPTTYFDRLGRRYVVDFRLLGATCDGTAEDTRLQPQDNGQRIYLGQQNFLLPKGEHTYTIEYLTARQIGFFKDHDELFWNVTGNGWAFPIAHASATVHLPSNVPAGAVHLSGFTGPQGSMDHGLESAADDGAFLFTSNAPLPPHSGLTILLTWPKGFVAEPTEAEKHRLFLEDNREWLCVAAGSILLLLYYLIAWLAVGRRPARSALPPIYEPPANLSPAAMRYLVRMGYDNKVFAAAILSLAVKGYLTIRQQAGSYTLYLTQNGKPHLSPDESEIAGKLFSGRTQLWLHNENHVTIRAAITALKNLLHAAEEKVYFFSNTRYMIPAALITTAALLGIALSHPAPQIAIDIFLCFWLTIWSLAVAGLLMAMAKSWKTAFAGGHASSSLIGKAVSTSLLSLPFVGGECLGIFFLAKSSSPLAVAFLLGSMVVHAIFYHLLKAPTAAGAQLLEQVAAFKQFLGSVEGERLNRPMPPDQSPLTFEKFLPYALALDVEQAWAEKFSAVVGSAAQTPHNNFDATDYSPTWYSGPGWTGLGAAGFASSMCGSLTSAISSSATAPGSGNGGGSGGSGGGGGGGGGGGW
jgi:uncharacterized membrane protein YgcG